VITGLDHVQVAIPVGGEEPARRFYGDLLQMTEVAKPESLAGRGGCWFTAGAAVLHLGVEAEFAAARKAHPAFTVTDLDQLREALTAAGHPCIDADDQTGLTRFHAYDPFGNRLEFCQII
jgi:catechol 2,3-dioxygenase-like lactoylglutathione lyase family enzyme